MKSIPGGRPVWAALKERFSTTTRVAGRSTTTLSFKPWRTTRECDRALNDGRQVASFIGGREMALAEAVLAEVGREEFGKRVPIADALR